MLYCFDSFLCSDAIKTARRLQLATTTPTHHQEPEAIIRSRINPVLTDHFLSCSQLLHGVYQKLN
jgi:hypothetical protein